MLQYENKFQKGESVFVIRQRPQEANVLEIKPYVVVGILLEDYPDGFNAWYLIKENPNNQNEQIIRMLSTAIYKTQIDAEAHLVDAALSLREDADNKIRELKRQISQIRKVRDNIQQVVPDELMYNPKSISEPASVPA